MSCRTTPIRMAESVLQLDIRHTGPCLVLLSLSLTNRCRLIRTPMVTLFSGGNVDGDRRLLDRGQSCCQCVFRWLGVHKITWLGFLMLRWKMRAEVSITLSDGAVSDIAGRRQNWHAISMLTTGATENNFDADKPRYRKPRSRS